jgi:hypothetical protein
MWLLRLAKWTIVNIEKIKGVWHEAFPKEKDIEAKFSLIWKKAIEDWLAKES